MQFSLRQSCAAVIFFVAFAMAQEVLAQAASSVFLEDLTWTELRDQVHAGKTTIIVPIGGTEQSGPDMALGKHNARVKVLSEKIAERLGNALVAPVIAYVPEGGYAPPSSHMRFPGTITVPDEVFRETLVSAAESFRVHGFMNIVFLGDHGGYQADLRQVAAELNKRWSGSHARAYVPAEYYRASSEGFAAILRQHGYRNDEIGTHAALADTALQLAVAPQMVRIRRLQNGARPGPAEGVYGGDPRRATPQLGQLGVDAIVDRTVAELQRIRSRRP